MKRIINSRFIAAVTALGLLAASFAPNQASAKDGEITRALAGLVALGILGAAIAEGAKANPPAYRPQPTTRPYRNNVTQTPVHPSTYARPSHKKYALPARCLRNYRLSGVKRQGYSNSCLKKHYQHTKRLPKVCKIEIRKDNGKKFKGYVPTCLQARGYRISLR